MVGAGLYGGNNAVVIGQIVGILTQFQEFYTCFQSCDSWSMTIEKLLFLVGYILFILGFAKPSFMILRVVERGFKKLTGYSINYINNTLVTFFPIAGHLSIQGYLTGWIGTVELTRLWDYVKESSQCIRLNKCDGNFNSGLVVWKQGLCGVKTGSKGSFNICEELFNGIPLILSTSVSGAIFACSYYGVIDDDDDDPDPGTGGSSAPADLGLLGGSGSGTGATSGGTGATSGGTGATSGGTGGTSGGSGDGTGGPPPKSPVKKGGRKAKGKKNKKNEKSDNRDRHIGPIFPPDPPNNKSLYWKGNVFVCLICKSPFSCMCHAEINIPNRELSSPGDQPQNQDNNAESSDSTSSTEGKSFPPGLEWALFCQVCNYPYKCKCTTPRYIKKDRKSARTINRQKKGKNPKDTSNKESQKTPAPAKGKPKPKVGVTTRSQSKRQTRSQVKGCGICKNCKAEMKRKRKEKPIDGCGICESCKIEMEIKDKNALDGCGVCENCKKIESEESTGNADGESCINESKTNSEDSNASKSGRNASDECGGGGSDNKDNGGTSCDSKK